MDRSMRRMAVGVALAVLCWAACDAAAAEPAKAASEAMGWGHTATIAPMKKAPTLDGKIEPGEWDNATGTVNFLDPFGKLTADFDGMHMDLREGRTLVGFHGDTLYIAVVSALPPRAIYGAGRYSVEKPRDAELIGDFNAVEIWIDPNRDRRESREGDQAFYQFFVNSVGSVYDAKLTPGEAPDKGWNTDVQSAHHIDYDRKIWTAEIAISLKGFGWTAEDAIGRSMGLLVSRNYKAPWNQATWFPHGGAFVSWYLYPRVFLTREGPVARIESLGEKFWDAQPEFRVRLFNPGPACSVKVSVGVKSSDMPDLKDEKEVALPAGGNADYVFAVSGERLHASADHLFNIRVTSADGARKVFDYTGMWTRDPRTTKGSGAGARPVRWSEMRSFEQKWDIRAQATPSASVSVAVYPSYNLIRVGTDAAQLVADPDGADKGNLSSSAVVTLARDGQELAKQDLAWDLSKNQFGTSYIFKLEDLPEGQYTVTAKFDKHPEPIVKNYKRIKFVWEGTTTGITDKIYPPFEAVQAGPALVRVVGREYGVGELGLWKSVKSLGREILAEPIVLRADGDRVLAGKAKLAKRGPMAATFEATAEDPAVTVRALTTTELDGCMRVELQLLPGTKKAELKSLALEVPLKAEEVPLWHAVTTAIRVNPMGETPKGEGVVWDSRQFPNGDWIGTFVPYIWLGGVERGMCVFGNNDRGWILNWNQKREFSPCQEFIRKGGAVTVRLNLVQKPITLSEPRTIVIGLMATPGKPVPYKDWRAMTVWGTRLGKGFEYLPRHNFSMGCAVEAVFNAAYPYNRDYSIYDALARIPGTPGGDLAIEKGFGAFLADWKQRNGLDKPPAELKDNQKMAVSRAGQHPGVGNYNAMYWDEYHNDYPGHPEVQVFAGEWRGNNMARSRRDFRCYYAAETVKRGIGLYFDNAFPHASKDTITSDAYEIPGLGIQCSANLWEQRDYHRRIWNIHREFGAKWQNRPMQMIHMTNTNVVPMLTWNDMNVDLEWFYGPEPQQSKYGLAMLQAETSGRQSGAVPYALATIENCRSAAEQRVAGRTKFGAMMVHEIRINLSESEIQRLARILYGFGYGTAGVLGSNVVGETVYNYWDEDYPVKCDQALVKSLLVRRGEELMLLVCSWDKAPATARFTFDTKALGLQLFTARDAEGTVEEQVAECRQRIETLGAAVKKAQDEYDSLRRRLEEKKATEQQVQQRLRVLDVAKARLEQAEQLVAIVEAAAKLPLAFDAQKAELTVGLEGYGVRLVRLK